MNSISQNYAFSHSVLLQYSKRFSCQIFQYFGKNDSFDLLGPILKGVGREANGADETRWTPSDILVTSHNLGERLCLLFQLPAPTSPTEAFMVAIVSAGTAAEVAAANKISARNPTPYQHPAWELRYFTLEMPSGLLPEQKSAFCEWDRGIRHLYRSSGPDPTAEDFLRFLEHFLAKEHL